MDLFKSLNQSIKLQEVEIAELREFVEAMDLLDSKNLFRMDEIFGGKDRKAEERRKEALARTAARGKSGRVEAEKAKGWQGGIKNEGRLAELVKLYGTPKFDNGTPPRKPKGMSPEDYKIWIEGFAKNQEQSKLGPAVGPEVGNIIRKNGVLYQVVSSSNLSSIAKDKEGRKIKVDWETLGKPVEKGGMTLYNAS